MKKEHHYNLKVQWTGNTGTGTSSVRGYERDHEILVPGKVPIAGSSDTAVNSDKTKHNPEDMLVAALASCHMLSYLYLCAKEGIVVVDYEDNATGTMVETITDGGQFHEVVLHPVVTVAAASMADKAGELHEAANKICYIANSVNFQVRHEAICKVAADS